MSLDTPLPETVTDGPSGLSRRGLIRNAAGAGAATLAASALLTAATGIAAAAEPSSTAGHANGHQAPAGAEETLIVHVRDARTGEIDIFHGHHHRTVRDRELTAALLRAAG
jgi:hypothetical protein